MTGVAVDLDSPGLKGMQLLRGANVSALNDATLEIQGTCAPFSLTGSLPLIAELKEAGFDLQMVGFGHSQVYHGTNEVCSPFFNVSLILQVRLLGVHEEGLHGVEQDH